MVWSRIAIKLKPFAGARTEQVTRRSEQQVPDVATKKLEKGVIDKVRNALRGS